MMIMVILPQAASAHLLPFGYEAGLTGGDGLLRKRRIQEWALRVKAKLDPSLPLVPDKIRVRRSGD